MNSVAPIASLADSLRRPLRRALEQVTVESASERALLDDVLEGIGIIQHRSEGLLRFAQVYRDLSNISTPVLSTVYLRELFSNIQGLMSPQLKEQGAELLTTVEPPDLRMQADSQLMEQVLINLVLNAAYAVRESVKPRIQLQAYQTDSGRVLIEVTDNGRGIPAEVLDSIFIPFFTTRKNGTGIGLSLAKQIMHLHHGSIKVQSVVGQGTVFRLEI
jgi:signal transduction histidine kinase